MAQTITRSISIDVAQENRLQPIVAKQYDRASRFLNVQFLDMGTEMTIEQGATIVINAKRSDGQGLSFSGSVNSDGTVRVPITYWMLELDGPVVCDISIITGSSADTMLTSTSFTLEVQAAAVTNADVEENEDYPVLLELIHEVSEFEPELLDIRNGVHGQTFNSAGDAVRASAEQLYNMKTGFDGVTYASPAAMVQGCDQKLQNEIYDVVDPKLKSPTMVENKYVNNSGEILSNSSWVYFESTDITPYMKLHIITYMSGQPCIAFYDKNDIFISRIRKESDVTVVFDEYVDIPENAKIVRISCWKANRNSFSMYTTPINTFGVLKGEIDGRVKTSDYDEHISNYNGLISNEFSEIVASWEMGAFSTDGSDVTTNSWIRTEYIDVSMYKTILENPVSGYKTSAAIYDKDKTFIELASGGVTQIRTETILPDNAYYVRFELGKVDGTNPTIGEYVNARIGKKTILQYDVDEGCGNGSIPDYYFENNYIINKVSRINELYGKYASNGTAFVFYTDEHWEHPRYNAQNSMALINYVYRNTFIPKLIDGGDNADRGSFDFSKKLKTAWGGKIYHVAGNHEYMYSTDEKEDELYAMWDASNNDQLGVNNRHYYYFNNEQEKIRYIVLSAYKPSGSTSTMLAQNGYEQDQMDWFENVALNGIESGWGIIIITHGLYGFNAGESGMGEGYYIPTTSNDQAVLDIITNYSGDGEIMGVISGHQHLDRVIYIANTNIPVIFTTCDANTVTRYVTADPRTSGTIGEQAFDVYILDRVEKKWHIVRIGTKAYDGIGSTPGDPVEERTVTYGA